MNAEPTGDWTEAEGRALHARLLELGVKVAAAESLTVGRVQVELGRVSGASKYFRGGITCYDTDLKVEFLKVEEAHAKAVNAVSAQVAEEMARGAARMFGACIGLATTGYANASPTVPEPFAWVAVTRGEAVRTAEVRGGRRERAEMQACVVAAVLRLLAGWLAEPPAQAGPPDP